MKVSLYKVIRKEPIKYRWSVIENYQTLRGKVAGLKQLAEYRLRIMSYLMSPYEIEKEFA